jgi:DNA-binding response OmpR family regulator
VSIVFVSGHGDVPGSVKAMKSGAVDFLTKPVDDRELLGAIERVVAKALQEIFSGVFERFPGLKVAIVKFELAWAPHVLFSMDYTYRKRHEEALYRFEGAMRPSDFFRRNVFLSFQEDAVGGDLIV